MMKLLSLNRVRAAFKKSAVVLMYHRVAAPAADPWQLAVSPQNFEQQLETLIKNYTLISVPELVEKLRQKKIRKNYVALTFDDGYIDNYLTAKPLLEKYKVPATFFIATDAIGSNKEYWWDELEKIILHTPELPARLVVEVKGTTHTFDLDKETVLTDSLRQAYSSWAYFEPPPVRGGVYLKLWELLSPLTHPEQQQVLAQLNKWASSTAQPRADYCCMTSEQLKELASNNLFHLGTHTASHPALAFHAKFLQQWEIEKSTAFLQELTGMKTSIMAYPSGSFNDDTLAILQQERYDAAFTTVPQPVTQHDDRYTLGRFQVNNWGKQKFEKALLQWFRL